MHSKGELVPKIAGQPRSVSVCILQRSEAVRAVLPEDVTVGGLDVDKRYGWKGKTHLDFWQWQLGWPHGSLGPWPGQCQQNPDQAPVLQQIGR